MLKLLYAIIGVFYLLVINLAFYEALRIIPVVGLMRFFLPTVLYPQFPEYMCGPICVLRPFQATASKLKKRGGSAIDWLKPQNPVMGSHFKPWARDNQPWPPDYAQGFSDNRLIGINYPPKFYV